MEAVIAAIQAAIDFAPVLTGLAAVAAGLGLLYVAIKGGKVLLGFIRS